MARWIAKYAGAVADLLMPRVCTVCDNVLLPSERHICSECLGDLPLTRFENLRRNPMADLYNEGLRDGGETQYCLASALFFYREGSGYDRITQALKYRRDFGTGRYFARMLADRLAASGNYYGIDIVVPVPLHWTRRWKRGYNQAEIIAAELASALGATPAPECLARTRRTSSQTGKRGTAAKQANVKGAFEARKPAGGNAVHHILIVDDVFTSGSTLIECHKALRTVFGAGVRISAATLAFVERG